MNHISSVVGMYGRRVGAIMLLVVAFATGESMPALAETQLNEVVRQGSDAIDMPVSDGPAIEVAEPSKAEDPEGHREITGSVSADIDGAMLKISADFSQAPSNVAFAVTGPSGKTKWVQAHRSDSDGMNWNAQMVANSVLEVWGSYRVEAYATHDGSTSSIAQATAVYARPSTSLAVESSKGVLKVSATSWSVQPDNVAFRVTAPSGSVRWLQGISEQDGWTAASSVLDDFGAWGVYQVTVFATFGSVTSDFGSASCSVAPGNLSAVASQSGADLLMSVSGWDVDVENVAFQVISPSGKETWVQALKGADGSWSASSSFTTVLGEWGSYKVRVWATVGNLTAPVAEARVTASAGSAGVSAAPSGAAFALRASGWSLAPDNVAFCVMRPSGDAEWLQGVRQQDGSWTAAASTMSNGIIISGSYTVSVWATHGKITSQYGSTSFHSADAGISATAMAQGDAISFVVTGFASSPSNVAFEVRLPSGKTVWKQARRSSDGSWSFQGAASGDFGELGLYGATAWATFGSNTFPYASSSCYVSAGRVNVAVRHNGSGTVAQASGWSIAPSNVAFEIIVGKKSTWLQGLKGPDGSWSAELDSKLASQQGRIVAWATMGRLTSSFGEAAFGTSSSGISVAAQVNGTDLSFSASRWRFAPSNVAFQVRMPSGRVVWLQGLKQDDGSWTASGSATDSFGEWGVYDVFVWATVSGETSKYGWVSCRVSLGAVAVTTATKGASATMSAQGWDIAPSNVAFQVFKPSGEATWIQGVRQPDGLWTASASVLGILGEWGSFRVIAWATVGKLTTSCGSSSFAISAGNVGVWSSVSGERFSLSAKGWMRFPTNVAFRVITPAGERWLQGYRQADGSWTASATSADGFTAIGTYRAIAYATIDGLTTAFGSTSFQFRPYQNDMHRRAQRYGSAANWLILVDTTSCRVGIFNGRAGNWNLVHFWLCSPGAPWTPTVKGEFTVQGRGYVFGYGYSCYYWTQFYGDYLFHSVLYDQGTFNIQDGRLGQNLSHGCVRLDINNAKWIYDNIPSGTKVVTY